MYTPFEAATLTVVLAMSSIAAITDFRAGLIPNSVVAAGASASVLVQLSGVVWGPTELLPAMQQMSLGLVLGSILPLTLYCFGALGGGDVKLFAAIGLAVGPTAVLAIELWSQVIAVLFLPLHWLRAGSLMRSLAASVRIATNMFVPARLRRPIDPNNLTTLRLAPAILLAFVWVSLLGQPVP